MCTVCSVCVCVCVNIVALCPVWCIFVSQTISVFHKSLPVPRCNTYTIHYYASYSMLTVVYSCTYQVGHYCHRGNTDPASCTPHSGLVAHWPLCTVWQQWVHLCWHCVAASEPQERPVCGIPLARTCVLHPIMLIFCGGPGGVLVTSERCHWFGAKVSLSLPLSLSPPPFLSSYLFHQTCRHGETHTHNNFVISR